MDDQTLTQGSNDKDPRSLSGGEKSFSTICLLLSLWESIGCPLRRLGKISFIQRPKLLLMWFVDEFDVFMDAVNRRILTFLLFKCFVVHVVGVHVDR